MSLTPLVASFVLVAIAELGDKTQIAVITLSSRFKALAVFSGAMLAFLLTAGIAVVIGDALTLVLPTFWIRIIAAIIFLIFGIKNEVFLWDFPRPGEDRQERNR